MAGFPMSVFTWLCCSVEDIFAAIENDPEPSATKYLVRASYLQIYNEVIVTLGAALPPCAMMFALNPLLCAHQCCPALLPTNCCVVC